MLKIALVIGVGASAIGVPMALAAGTATTDPLEFREPNCGISFAIPPGWTVKVVHDNRDQASCLIVLSPPPDRDFLSASPGSDQPCHFGEIRLGVQAKSFQEVAQQGEFTRVEGQWHYMAGSVFDSVRILAGKDWHGVKAHTSTHLCGAAQGFDHIVIGRESRAVSIEAYDANIDVVETLLKTLDVNE